MRRAELIKAVETVVQTREASKLLEVLLPLTIYNTDKESKGIPPSELFKALNVYSINAHNFDSNAKKVAHLLGLSVLENAGYWSRFLASAIRVDRATKFYDIVRFAQENLMRLLDLLKPEVLRIMESEKKENQKFIGKSLLSVILLEDKTHYSSPERLIDILSGITSLYEACAIMMDLPTRELSVIACDSGSDKSFDFLGAAKVIESVKEIILSLWDRVVFFREKQISQRLELIAEALPIIEEISKLEKDNKMGREQAEILRRKVLDGVGKFIECGAIIPEIQDRSHFNPRLLMTPEPKLLSSSIEAELPEDPPIENLESSNNVEYSNDDEDDISTLSEEERAMYELLKLKSRRKKKNLNEED